MAVILTPTWEQLPPEYASFQALAEAALDAWIPDGRCILKPLSPGASGAVVLLLDVIPAQADGEPNGKFILKLSHPLKWVDQVAEKEAHRRAMDYARDFAGRHIPALLDEFPRTTTVTSPLGYAMLYAVAGGSLDSYQATDARDSSRLLVIAESVASDILYAWADAVPGNMIRPHELLIEWLGYRLSANEAQAFHTFANRFLKNGLFFVPDGEALPNPLRFHEELKHADLDLRPRIGGLLHNDLHGGNLLCFSRDPLGRHFQIIDFGLSTVGPIGFDQAYLELWALLRSLGEHPASRLLALMRSLDHPERRDPPPDQTQWAADLAAKVRAGADTWKADRMGQRVDDVDRQLCLARVAAGINWANKCISDNWTHLALCYAGWAARLYIERHEPDKLGHLLKDPSVMRSIPPSNAMSDQLWNALLEATGRFSRSAGRFVLVAEGLRGHPHAAALGQLPWSAVIDLDPDSETAGLHSLAAPILQCHRGIHLFVDSAPPASSLERGCAWMLAGGRMSEKKLPLSLTQWVMGPLPRIRTLLRQLHEKTTPTPLFILMLPGASHDPQQPMERLTRIADAAFEASEAQAKVIVLGHANLPSSLDHHQLIPLQVRAFFEQLYVRYGTSTAHLEAAVPGADGWVVIPIDALRAMQEVLMVLHSRALDDEPDAATSSEADGFWRGNPPTLHDLAGDVDIPRDIQPELVKELRKQLEAHTNRTVVFSHQPGAGGTTAALRALWELRTEFPAAIIRKWSPAVVDRVKSLGRLTGKPVLLVAEASPVLLKSDLEDLNRGLRDANCRAVILYLERVLKEPEPGSLGLDREMSEEEALKFCRVFEELTDDAHRQTDLRRITHDSSLARYRSPFFYGLITFEREYVGVERYVAEHLRELRDKPRTLLKYLAVCTIYSNGGIPEPVCKLLRGQSADSSLSMAELLGEGPARLVKSSTGQWRLLHQVLAEEVLSHLMGSDWRLDLMEVAREFIRDLHACIDPNSEQVNEMLRELFIDRQGGGDDVEDRAVFSPLITEVTQRVGRPEPGKRILAMLRDKYPHNAHFWNHLGRFQVYEMRSDFSEAERCLEQAVQLSPHDRIQHTTLGIVRRRRLREVIDEATRYGSRTSPEDLLETTRGHFDRAAKAFDDARNLAPEDRYAYISHIEMFIWMADALKRLMGVTSIGDLGEDHAEVAEWLAEQIEFAETLLNEARRLYGSLDRNRDRLRQCESGLSKLYGDFDAVIRIWEISESRGQVSPRRRRAIAHAYLARGKRQWRKMSQAELHRIARLMDDNLRGASRVEEDYRLWFEASMLLPDFDYDQAISNLLAWSQRWVSWRSHYYLYILYFMRWFTGRSNSLDELEEALASCSHLVVGRKYTSEQWMATTPPWCPLISSLDLGAWDEAHEFWPSEQLLRRVNGVIKRIDGPQAGQIQIEGRLHIFFVPGGKRVEKDNKTALPRRHVFERNKDEEASVTFFLGFSPVGLRAWMVEPGRAKCGDRKADNAHSEAYRPVVLSAPELPEQVVRERLARLQHHTLLRFAYDLAKARAELEAPLTLDELRGRIEAVVGVDALFSLERLGIIDFENLLIESGDFEILVASGGTKLVRAKVTDDGGKSETFEPFVHPGFRHIGWIDWHNESGKGRIKTPSGQSYHFSTHFVESPSRGEVHRGRLVEFSEGSKIGTAAGVRVLSADLTLYYGRPIESEELRPLVEAEILKRVRKAADASKGVPLHELQQEMERIFLGAGRLFDRLRQENFGKLINTFTALRIVRTADTLYVHLSSAPGFGRVPAPPKDSPNRLPKRELLQPNRRDNPVARKNPSDSHASSTVLLKQRQKESPSIAQAVSSASAGRKPADHKLTPPKTAAAPRLSSKEALEVIRNIVAEAISHGESRLSLTDLGIRCRKKLTAGHEFPKKSLNQLVKAIPGLKLCGDGPTQYLLLDGKID